MIQTKRSSLALLLTLCFSLALLSACGSDSNEAPAGKLRILITNDDGVAAPGIDAVVQAVTKDENNSVIVSAPLANRSGSADNTIDTLPACGTGEATPSETMSGYDTDVWAVDGCPADSVLYALANLYPDGPPHVVLSGINEGQNVGFVNGGALSQVSGTVGAAKTAACSGVPALASSQGEGEEIDYPRGLEAVLSWLEANRADLLAGNVPLDNITSINIPSCDAGAIRGEVDVPLATEIPPYVPNLAAAQDCESTRENLEDDVSAFFNGFVTTTPVPSNSNDTCDKLAD
jgi:5'-nucleotidase